MISKSTVAKCCGGIAAVTGTSAGTAALSNGNKTPGATLPILTNHPQSSLPQLKEDWITPTPKPQPPEPKQSSGSTDSSGDSQSEAGTTGSDDSQKENQESDPNVKQKEEPPNASSEPAKEEDNQPKPPEPDPSREQSQNGFTSNGDANPCMVLLETIYQIATIDGSEQKVSKLQRNISILEDLDSGLNMIDKSKDNLSSLKCNSK